MHKHNPRLRLNHNPRPQRSRRQPDQIHRRKCRPWLRKSGTAVSAFQKLDAAKAGYVTKEQAAKLNGFDFTQADKNKDGELDRDEFNAAWGAYSGKPQG